MWRQLVTTLPAIAAHPLAILAYILVVAAWLIWLLRRQNTNTFLSAIELLDPKQRHAFALKAGYRYDELANLTREQQYSLITRRYWLVALIATLVSIAILVALILAHQNNLARMQERIDQLARQKADLETLLETRSAAGQTFAVAAAVVVGQLSIQRNDPEIVVAASQLKTAVDAFVKDYPREQARPEIQLVNATLANSNGDYDAAFALVDTDAVGNLVSEALVVLRIRATALYGKQRWADAHIEYEKIRSLDPKDYQASLLAANSLLHTSKSQEAIAAYGQFLAAAQNSTDTATVRFRVAALNNRGILYGRSSQNESAVRDFSEALKLLDMITDSTDLSVQRAVLVANRAQTLQVTQQKEAAAKDFATVRAIVKNLDPSHGVGSSTPEILEWLQKKAEPLKATSSKTEDKPGNETSAGKTEGPIGEQPPGADHQKAPTCFVCHAGEPPQSTNPPPR